MVAVNMRTVPSMSFMHGPVHRDEKVTILVEVAKTGHTASLLTAYSECSINSERDALYVDDRCSALCSIL